MKTKLTGAVVLISILIAGSALSMGQKKKTSSNIPLVIQFTAGTGAHVTSPYTYTDGENGVSAYFNNDSTQDLILRAGTGMPITCSFWDAESGALFAFCGTTFNPGVTQGTAVTVFKAGSLAPGASGEFAAKMESSGTTGTFRLSFGATDTETNGYLLQSRRVVVYREDVDHWIVSTTVNEPDACPGQEGGDKGDLMQYVVSRGKTSLNQVGFYHMPFQFTATRK